MKNSSNLAKWLRALFIVVVVVVVLICTLAVFFILATADDGTGNIGYIMPLIELAV